ncbi:MAG: RDD family protein [Elusimicrobiaceae bacterium]
MNASDNPQDQNPEGFVPPAQEPQRPVLASFSERLVAYMFDGLPFLFLSYLSLYFFISSTGRAYSSQLLMKWNFLWIFIYVVYLTVFNAGGRVTLGKAILGLKVRTYEGGDLTVFQSFVRAAGYFLSSALFYIGYIMALFSGLALHDRMAHTFVEKTRHRSVVSSVFTFVLAWVMFWFMVWCWYYSSFMQYTQTDMTRIETARKGLYGLARLQALHKEKAGFYTDDIGRLASLTGNPEKFRSELLNVYRPEGFELGGNKDYFLIRARAKDFRGTVVELSGPPDPVRKFYRELDTLNAQ